MNEKWTDFEKIIFKKIISIERRISRLEGKLLILSALAGGVVSAAVSLWPKK